MVMRFGVLSDAHGNVEAFALACRLLRRHGADELLFLGDAVGYLPGGGVVNAIISEGIDAVRGNHEAMLLSGRTPDAEDAYQLAATRAMLSHRAFEEIASWPATRRLELARGPAVLVHGSPSDPTFGYVYPDAELDEFASCAELAGSTVFMGNTHRPFVRRHRSTTFVNVGSCGLPRDVGGLGAACLYDDSTGEARIVRFDIRAETARALARCGPVHDIVTRTITRTSERYVGELVT